MSASKLPPEWDEDSPHSWSHSRLPVELELIQVGDEWDLEVTPLPGDMPWHSLKVDCRKKSEGEERKVAVEYMTEFSDIELSVRKKNSDLSEERKVLIASIEAIQNIR